MRTRSDKRTNRKNDRKVFVAEESNKNWADSESDSTSSSSSSSDSEPEEVHCFMADQITTEYEICILLKNAPDLELGEAKEFPPLKILTAKTVGTYIAKTKNIFVDLDEPAVEKSVEKKKAVSKKRPATTVEAPVKRKRTTTERAAPEAKSLALVTVAQEAVPIQMVSVVTPHAPKRKAPKRKLKLPVGSDDEIVETEPDVENVVEKQREKTTVDDVDKIIDQFLKEALRSGENDDLSGSKQPSKIIESRSDVSATTKYIVKKPLEMEKDHGKEIEAIAKTVEGKTSDDESMSIDDILATISEDSMLPYVTTAEITRIQFGRSIEIRGVQEGDWHKASLPKTPADAKLSVLGSTEDIATKIESLDLCNRLGSDSSSEARKEEILETHPPDNCFSHVGNFASTVFADTLPPISAFFKLLRKCWADICIAVALFVVSGRLQPVGSHNFCRVIVAVGVGAAADPHPAPGTQRNNKKLEPENGSHTSILPPTILNNLSLISVRELRNQYLCDPKWFRDTASRGLTTFVTPKPHFRTNQSDHGKASTTSPHDPLGITDSAWKNQSVMVSIQYDPFKSNIPIRSTTIGITDSAWKNQSVMVSIQYDPFKSNIPIRSTTIDSIGYPHTRASGKSSTTKHRLLHASGPHPTPPPDDPN
ncbi:coiled-coil domain-containing protein 94 [Dorcoceras hygrometricum]|uniref:Coiled-coil domain-containing protein 94 n=1 Tax=Dorcoceras hygrometricum TaxID=472368 RepID=A0A2Z7DI25_9LAMI|nr:coiled-coil domain-containing protein 94 [Dorcoceras hygrometricum]